MPKVNSFPRRCVLMTAMLWFLTAAASLGQTPDQPSLDSLLKLKPAERMKLLANMLNKDKDFVTLTAGPLKGAIIERGSLQAVDVSDVICRLRR